MTFNPQVVRKFRKKKKKPTVDLFAFPFVKEGLRVRWEIVLAVHSAIVRGAPKALSSIPCLGFQWSQPLKLALNLSTFLALSSIIAQLGQTLCDNKFDYWGATGDGDNAIFSATGGWHSVEDLEQNFLADKITTQEFSGLERIGLSHMNNTSFYQLATPTSFSTSQINFWSFF